MSNKSQDAESKQPDSSFIQLDDAKQKGAASAASAPRRKALVGVLTAACIALIVVSLGFVHPSTSGAWSLDWIAGAVHVHPEEQPAYVRGGGVDQLHRL